MRMNVERLTHRAAGTYQTQLRCDSDRSSLELKKNSQGNWYGKDFAAKEDSSEEEKIQKNPSGCKSGKKDPPVRLYKTRDLRWIFLNAEHGCICTTTIGDI